MADQSTVWRRDGVELECVEPVELDHSQSADISDTLLHRDAPPPLTRFTSSEHEDDDLDLDESAAADHEEEEDEEEEEEEEEERPGHIGPVVKVVL